MSSVLHLPKQWSVTTEAASKEASGKRKGGEKAEEGTGARKKAKGEVASAPETAAAPAVHDQETSDILERLFFHVGHATRYAEESVRLNDGIFLEGILSSCAYADTMESMFGGVKEAGPTQRQVPIITKRYGEMYMRECHTAFDEPCIMGPQCEMNFIDENNPFVGVRLRLPIETVNNMELHENKLCLLCCRKQTQSLFFDLLYYKKHYNGVIQLFGEICDKPGEYAKDAMLICPLNGPLHALPAPIVAHQRNRYAVMIHHGVRYLKQVNVSYEDFHKPSS